MDGHIVGSMISANSITGEQIQANSIKTANLELSVQKKIQNATDEETVKALIKADLDGFESTLSKEFITVENAATQIQQATEVAVKEATQNIIDNAVSESMGAVDGQLNDKLNQYTSGTLLPAIAEKAEEVLQNAEDYVVTQLESYATKKELSSSISQTREQIELSVSEKYTTKAESATIITEAIDGITVGAINRVLGTSESKSFKFNGGANETWLPYKFSNDVSDKEVFVSFKYTLTGTAQNGSQIQFAPSYLKKANNQTVYRPKHIFFTSNRLQDVNITDTVSFTTKDFQDISPSSTSYIRFVGNGFTGTLSISEVQIKPGNSKTTWSPAPEDTITDITNAKNDAIGSANSTLIATIANYYTKSETDSAINVAKDEINLGVSNTYETKTNVETKVSSTLNSAKSYADTKKTEAINSAATDATSKVNAAKSELNTAIGKKANTADVYSKAEVYTKVQTDSAIKVAKDEINLGVSNTYETKANVETKITSIQIGGTNLVRKGSVCKYSSHAYTTVDDSNFYADGSAIFSRTAVTNEGPILDRYVTYDDGANYCLSFKLKITSGSVNSIHIYNGRSHKNSKVYIDGVHKGTLAKDLDFPTDSNYHRVEVYFTAVGTDEDTANARSTSHIILQPIKNTATAYAAQLLNLQVEKGTKVTGWSLSPEDMNAIAAEAKSDAISTAATDATNKANNAKNEAITSANNTLTTTIANYYTKKETDSNINIAKEAIELGVSTKYETKANVETMVSSINVGGRNYVRDYMFEKQDVWQRFKTTSTFIDNNNNFGRLSSDSGSVWLYQIMPFETFKKGQVVTIQYEIKCEDISQNTGTNSMLIRTQLTGYDNNGTHIKDVCIFGMHEKEVDNLSEWTKVTVTRTIGDVGASTQIHLRLYARNFIGKVYFRNVKLELGNKATDLSPAPEDTISDINDAKNEAITSANNTLTTTIANYYTKAQTDSQINVAKNAITSSVSSTYETKTNVTNKINGVNSSISSLQTRMNTAESKITDTAITNTVKKNFYTKTETENAITSKGYATQSQVQQTADNIQFKFTQTGGYNLIRNGNPKPNNYSHWWVSGNANWYLGSTTDIGVQTIDTNEAYAGSATFKVEPGKTYSFSCWLMAESNTKGTDVYFIGSANDDGAYTEVHHLFTSGSCGWTQVKKTFTLGSSINYGFIRIDNNGRKDTSNGAFTVVFFSEVMLVKGQDYFPQWSPNPNEVYDGITTIDKSGINVSASNINGYAKMTANGFFVNKAGKDLVSVDGYGLRLFDAKIQLTHANGNKYFLLDENGIVMYNPANGTHQWGKVAAINNKFTVASNGNSSGLSLGHHVNDNYVEDILCDSNGVVSVQRQINHNGVFYNNYGQMFVRQSGQGGWEITGRSDSQSIKPGGANQGGIGSNTQYINQSWIANRYNPSSLEIKHLSHYVDDLECLKLVSEVQPARYFYKEYDEDGNDITTFTTKTSQLGLIYEDVRECSGRDLLTNEEDKAINSYGMVSVLWGAVRNLNERLNKLEYENALLNDELQNYKQKEGND